MHIFEKGTLLTGKKKEGTNCAIEKNQHTALILEFIIISIKKGIS